VPVAGFAITATGRRDTDRPNFFAPLAFTAPLIGGAASGRRRRR